MPWSEGVIEQFEIVDLYTTEESDFYGPFNSLLVELFPSSEHYQVSPHFGKRIDGSLDFTVHFIVHRRRLPVFFLDVKTFCSLTLLSARDKADNKMRQTFREFASGTILTATLYGLSAFGPQFCVYAFESATRSINPPAIARELAVINDTAPEVRWAYNLLEPAGGKISRGCERGQRNDSWIMKTFTILGRVEGSRSSALRTCWGHKSESRPAKTNLSPLRVS